MLDLKLPKGKELDNIRDSIVKQMNVLFVVKTFFRKK